MSPIITQPGLPAHVHPDTAARQRRDRLDTLDVGQMEAALAFLSMIDPEAFEIALTAAAPLSSEPSEAPEAPEAPEDEEPFPVCRQCGAQVGIFLARGLGWQHFRGDGVTSGAQQVYDPGHPAQVAWLLPGENLQDLEDL